MKQWQVTSKMLWRAAKRDLRVVLYNLPTLPPFLSVASLSLFKPWCWFCLVFWYKYACHSHALDSKSVFRRSGVGQRALLTVPTHIEVTATLLSCLLSSDNAVTIWRAPVQPNGWPRALTQWSIHQLNLRKGNNSHRATPRVDLRRIQAEFLHTEHSLRSSQLSIFYKRLRAHKA